MQTLTDLQTLIRKPAYLAHAAEENSSGVFPFLAGSVAMHYHEKRCVSVCLQEGLGRPRSYFCPSSREKVLPQP